MASVTRLEESATAFMEPLMDGSYREETNETAHLWRCDGCGLVWEKKWHAATCEQRRHVSSFPQGPYGVAGVVNGRPVPFPGGEIRYYTRRAVRRDVV